MTPFSIFTRLILVLAIIMLLSSCSSAPIHDTDLPMESRHFVAQANMCGVMICGEEAAERYETRERYERREREKEADDQRQWDRRNGVRCEQEYDAFRRVWVCR